MAEKNQLFIAYFPYLTMGDIPEIDFGFLKIWNFDYLKEKYIPDRKIRAKVAEILGMYKAFFVGSLRGIGMVSIGDTDFRIFNDKEKEKIRLAKLILFLSFLSKKQYYRI